MLIKQVHIGRGSKEVMASGASRSTHRAPGLVIQLPLSGNLYSHACHSFRFPHSAVKATSDDLARDFEGMGCLLQLNNIIIYSRIQLQAFYLNLEVG